MKTIKRALSLFIVLILVIMSAVIPFVSYAAAYSSSQTKAFIDSTISYKQKLENEKSIQSLINGALTRQAGTGAEWYILSLLQYNPSLNFSSYRNALQSFVYSQSGNPVEKEKYALLLAATGSDSAYITDTISSSTGALGIMSYVYSLHLLNLGYIANGVTKQNVINELLSFQLPDGGFAISGKYGDVDTTAMVLQSLSQNTADKSVKSAVNRGLDFLALRLDDNCEYSSYGAVNSESTSQVIIALSALGIDCCRDSRFTRSANTLIDTLLSYKQSDLGFSHTHEKGTDGYATVQALMAFVSYYRFLNSKGSIYKFTVKPVSVPQTTQPTTQKPSQPVPSTTKAPASTTQKPAVTTKQSTTITGTTSGQNNQSGNNGISDVFGIFSFLTSESGEKTTAPQTASQITSQASVQTTTTPSTTVSPVTQISTTAQVSVYSQTVSAETETSALTVATSDSGQISISQTQLSSQREIISEGASTVSASVPPSSQTQYPLSETAQSQPEQNGKKTSAVPYICGGAIIICAAAAVIVLRKRRYG